VFFNVQEREPQVIPQPEHESFQDELKLRTFAGRQRPDTKSLVFKPEEIYRKVRRRCALSLGRRAWERVAADIAPTRLDLAGYEIPETMQGRSWLGWRRSAPIQVPKERRLCTTGWPDGNTC